jgi:hypothetical protein
VLDRAKLDVGVAVREQDGPAGPLLPARNIGGLRGLTSVAPLQPTL